MTPITNLTNHLFLWHLAPTAKAGRICEQGFKPKGQPLQNHPSRPVWFFTSGFSFVERAIRYSGKRGGNEGFLVALPIDALTEPWDGQIANEFMAFQPVPADAILCRFPADEITDRESLLSTLETRLGPDLVDQLTSLSVRDDIPWSHRTSAACTLLYLDRERYERERITSIALADQLQTTDSDELARRITEIDFRFYHYFLRHYYFEYGERHVARALLTAAARRIGQERVFAMCTDPGADPGHNRIAQLLRDIRPIISKADLTCALFELRVMHPSRLSDTGADQIDRWLLDQAESAELASFHIAHGDLHGRLGKVGVRLSASALQQHHPDPYAVVSQMAESHLPLARLGAVRAYAVIRDERSIPFLASCLESRWKKMREETVRTLGALASEQAQTLIRSATNDKSGKIRDLAKKLVV
jgi:hypothetical protein